MHPQERKAQAFNMVSAVNSRSEDRQEVAKGRVFLKLKMSYDSALCQGNQEMDANLEGL